MDCCKSPVTYVRNEKDSIATLSQDCVRKSEALPITRMCLLITRRAMKAQWFRGPSLVTLEASLRIFELSGQAFDPVVVDLGFVNAARWS